MDFKARAISKRRVSPQRIVEAHPSLERSTLRAGKISGGGADRTNDFGSQSFLRFSTVLPRLPPPFLEKRNPLLRIRDVLESLGHLS